MRSYLKYAPTVLALVFLGLWSNPAPAYVPGDADYHAVWEHDPIAGSSNWIVLKDKYNYGPPAWQADLAGNMTKITVPNVFDPEMLKRLWAENTWFLESSVPEAAPVILLQTQPGVTVTPKVPIRGSLDWSYYWQLDPQPSSETLIFPNEDYYLGQGGLYTVEVGTMSVPEPAALSLVGIGGLTLGVLAVARRRGRTAQRRRQ